MKLNLILVCFINLLRYAIGSYILYPSSVDFSQAVLTCDSINATVLFIDNSAEDDFIKNNYLNNKSVKDGIWLAIYDFIGNDTNVNYYTNQTLNYTNWNPHISNVKSQLCTRYEKKSYIGWGDDPCSKSYSV